MSKVQNSFHLELLLSIVGFLVFMLQLVIAFVVKGIKKSIDDLWNRIDLISDRLNKLIGEHEAICRGKHDKT